MSRKLGEGKSFFSLELPDSQMYNMSFSGLIES